MPASPESASVPLRPRMLDPDPLCQRLREVWRPIIASGRFWSADLSDAAEADAAEAERGWSSCVDNAKRTAPGYVTVAGAAGTQIACDIGRAESLTTPQTVGMIPT